MNPFASRPEDAIGKLGETALLARIREWLGTAAPPSPAGMGDDTAVLPETDANLVTTDSLVYQRHFDDAVTPAQAGAKLLKRNLSDIAAMGGTPRQAVMAGFLPPHTATSWLAAFTRSMAECARQYGVDVVGGDLTQTAEFLGFNLTLLGYAPQPLLRTGARVGDSLWVTGQLGGSIQRKHWAFEPRLEAGQWLARRGRKAVRALIDVTDGLGKDLPALLPPGSAASLDLHELPVSQEARQTASVSGRPLLYHVFNDGEDYELLFALAAEEDLNRFRQAWAADLKLPVSRIGKIVTASTHASLLDAATGRQLSFGSGYEHFRAT